MSVLASEIITSTIPFIETGVAEAQSTFLYQRHHSRWLELRAQLESWKNDPSQLEDEGVIAPSIARTQIALAMLEIMRKMDGSIPLRIVPDGEGGIVFEYRISDPKYGTTFQSIEINSDSSAEVVIFQDSKLVERQTLDLGLK